MKRLVMLVLCLTLCLCCSVPVQAGNASLTLAASKSSVYGGDEITISMRMTAAAMGGLQTNLTWDPNCAVYVEGSAAFSSAFKADAMIAQINAGEGSLSLLYANTKGYTAQDEVVFTAKFKMAETVNATTNFALKNTKMTDAAAGVNAMTVSVQGVSVSSQEYHPGEAYITLNCDQQWPAVGDEVTVSLSVSSSNAAVGSVQGTIVFDPSVLELAADSAVFTAEASALAVTKSLNTSANGKIRFVYAAVDGCPTAALLEMRFKVIASQPASIILENVKATNSDAAHLSSMNCWPNNVYIYPQTSTGNVIYTLAWAPGTSCADETITLNLAARGAAIGGMQGTLVYDASQMEYVSGSARFADGFAADADVKLINDTKSGTIQLVYANSKGYMPNGNAIFTVQFRLKKQENLTPVTLTELKTTDAGRNGPQELVSTFKQNIDWNRGLHTVVVDPAVKPTCTAAGKTEGKHCSVCNVVIKAQTTIPAKEHTEVTDQAAAATCTAAGKTEGKHCSVCNAVIKAQTTIPAKGHSWDAGAVTRKPTTAAEGVLTYTCTVCKATQTEKIPVRLPGDANSDGKVQSDDVLRVFDYISGKKVSISLYNADVNQNDKVDIQDALMIMQYLSGWDVKLQ